MEHNFRDFAVSLATEAATQLASDFHRNGPTSWKADGTPVTSTDLAVNDLVIDAVRQSYPSHSVLGEEKSALNGDSAEWTWVCDPLDGTIPFGHSIPTFAFS